MLNIDYTHKLWDVGLNLCENFITRTKLHSCSKDLSSIMNCVLDNSLDDITLNYLSDDINVRNNTAYMFRDCFTKALLFLNNCYNPKIIRSVVYQFRCILRNNHYSLFILVMYINSIFKLIEYLEIDDTDLFNDAKDVINSTPKLLEYILKKLDAIRHCNTHMTLYYSKNKFKILFTPSEFFNNKRERIRHFNQPGLQMIRRLRTYNQLSYFSSSMNPQHAAFTVLRFI